MASSSGSGLSTKNSIRRNIMQGKRPPKTVTGVAGPLPSHGIITSTPMPSQKEEPVPELDLDASSILGYSVLKKPGCASRKLNPGDGDASRQVKAPSSSSSAEFFHVLRSRYYQSVFLFQKSEEASRAQSEQMFEELYDLYSLNRSLVAKVKRLSDEEAMLEAEVSTLEQLLLQAGALEQAGEPVTRNAEYLGRTGIALEDSLNVLPLRNIESCLEAGSVLTSLNETQQFLTDEESLLESGSSKFGQEAEAADRFFAMSSLENQELDICSRLLNKSTQLAVKETNYRIQEVLDL